MKTIREIWRGYFKACYAGKQCSSQQVGELQQAFYSGAIAALSELSGDPFLTRLEQLFEEASEFIAKRKFAVSVAVDDNKKWKLIKALKSQGIQEIEDAGSLAPKTSALIIQAKLHEMSIIEETCRKVVTEFRRDNN